jgi:glycosyl transferase family 6
MLRTISSWICQDLSAGITAKWHDESHLNRFFVEHKALVNTLDPGFAFPKEWETAPFDRKILHLAKSDEEFGNLGAAT